MMEQISVIFFLERQFSSRKRRVFGDNWLEFDCGTYERDLKAEILDWKPRATLKTGAIPTVFFASKTIKKTSTIIGETFRRESQKRGN